MNQQNALANLIKEHNSRQNVAKEMQEKRKNEAIVAAHNLTEAIVDHLNIRVSHSYNSQKRLDIECKKLENNSANLAKQAEQWVELVEQTNQSLKEIGDIESWSRAIESDVALISNVLKRVHQNQG